jgi:hypothetical protein
MYFEEYDPQRFASLYERVGPKLREFFARPVVIALLEGSVKLRRPAVEAIEDHLSEYASEDVKDQRVRQLVGHMIRHLMKELGYDVEQLDVRIPAGVLFTCGARYRPARRRRHGLSKCGPDDSEMHSDDVAPLSHDEVDRIIRNGERLLVLWRGIPRRVYSQSWERFGLGCVTRAYVTLGSLLRNPNGDDVDGATIARSLYEHVVAFAWMAASPDERLKMLLRTSAKEASKTAAELQKLGSIAIGADMLKELDREKRGDQAPGVADQALSADAYWSPRVQSWTWGFRRTYANLFRPYSWFVHPSPWGIDVFFDEEGSLDFTRCDASVGHVRAAAVASFADALVVASQVLGWPTTTSVLDAYTEKLV